MAIFYTVCRGTLDEKEPETLTREDGLGQGFQTEAEAKAACPAVLVWKQNAGDIVGDGIDGLFYVIMKHESEPRTLSPAGRA